MVGVEAAAVTLGAAVVRSACKLWLGGGLASEASTSVTDMLEKRISGHIEHRKAIRFFEDCSDIVAARLLKVVEANYRDVPPNEREAAILAVSDVFSEARIDLRSVLEADLDPRMLERQLTPTVSAVLSRAALRPDAEPIFRYLLRESCLYMVQVVMTLPAVQAEGTAEILRRHTDVLTRVERVLERLPERRGTEDFVADYRRQVAILLDRMELFGARLRGPGRSYPLSVAYLSLRATSSRRPATAALSSELTGGRVEQVLANRRRILLIGEAGSGKTTLLRWLAVRSARQDFPHELRSWNDTVPFLIPLRRFVGKPLPQPEHFLNTVAPSIAEETPKAWAQSVLRRGRGLVLIDGIDEMPSEQRREVQQWLEGLALSFPDSRYVITSRPEALNDDWLIYSRSSWIDEYQRLLRERYSAPFPHRSRSTGRNPYRLPATRFGYEGVATGPLSPDTWRFDGEVAQLQPLSPTDIKKLVAQWHLAIGEQIHDNSERDELNSYEQAVLIALDADRHLRRLAVNPLLCALLCALNRELRTHLPRSRMEIYEAALAMLIEQRDRERGVRDSNITLSKTDKINLLQEIALWLVRNGRSDASFEEAANQIELTLRSLPQRAELPDASEVFRHLLERSGVLREPVAGRVDFIHKTFQEYLAGRAAVEAEMIGELVKNSHDHQWREVVVMAAGHARPNQCAALLVGLQRRAQSEVIDRHRLLLTSVACLQTSSKLDPDLRKSVEDSARELMPPRSSSVAQVLATAGDFVLDLLPPPKDPIELASTLETATLIGGNDALTLIARIASDGRWHGRASEFLACWESFDRKRFASEVLSRVDLSEHEIDLGRSDGLLLLRFMPSARTARISLASGGMSYPEQCISEHLERLDVVLDGSKGDHPLYPLDLGSDPEVEIAEIRRVKEDFIDRQDFEGAATARDVEKWLLRWRTTSNCFASLSAVTVPGVHALSISRPFPRLQQIGISHQLRSLVISGWRSVAGVEELALFPNLTELALKDCDLSGVPLTPLVALKRLQRLQLEGGAGWTPDLATLANFPNLQELVIGECEVVDLAAFGSRVAQASPLTVRIVPHQRTTGEIETADSLLVQRQSLS